jgi:DNA invertase Pin-like site-specific DNA recombinase
MGSPVETVKSFDEHRDADAQRRQQWYRRELGGEHRSYLHSHIISKGGYKGRKATVDQAQIRALRQDGLGPSAIAAKLNISRMTVHRALAE